MATSNKSKKILEKARKIAAKTKKKKVSKVEVKKKTTSYPEGQNPPQSKKYTQESDKTLSAKATGWRWTREGAKKLGKSVESKPTTSDIEKYRNETFRVKGKINKSGPKGVGDGSYRYLYVERRADKADITRKNKLAKGGAIWTEIHDDYEEDGVVYIDAWMTSDDNEEGKVIAKVKENGEVIYLDERAKKDSLAQEVINDVKKRKKSTGGYMAGGGRILVGRFDENQLRNKEDKKAVEKAQKETGLKYVDTKIIKKGGKMILEVYLIPNEEYYKSSKFANGGMMAKGGKTKGKDKHQVIFYNEEGEQIDAEYYDNYPSDAEVEDLAKKLGAKTGHLYRDKYKTEEYDEKIADYEFKKGGKISRMADDGMMAKGGKIPSSEVADFKKYVKQFYGKDEMYSEFFPPLGASNDEINLAVSQYIEYCKTKDDQWGGGDSFDREIVRDIMLYNRGKIARAKRAEEMGTMKGLEYQRAIKEIFAKDKKEYGGILQPMTGGVNADPRFDIYNTTMFAKRGAELPKGYFEYVSWDEVQSDPSDNNKGYIYGINLIDEDSGEILDVEWFKSEDEREKAIKKYNLVEYDYPSDDYDYAKGGKIYDVEDFRDWIHENHPTLKVNDIEFKEFAEEHYENMSSHAKNFKNYKDFLEDKENEYIVSVEIENEDGEIIDLGINVFANNEDEAMDKAEASIRENDSRYEDSQIAIVSVKLVKNKMAKGGETKRFELENYTQYDVFFDDVIDYIKQEYNLSDKESRKICDKNESLIESEFDNGSSPKYTGDSIASVSEIYSKGGEIDGMRERVIDYYFENDVFDDYETYGLEEEDLKDLKKVEKAIIDYHDLKDPKNVKERYEVLGFDSDEYAKGGRVEYLRRRFEGYSDEELQIFNGDNEETLKNWNRKDAIEDAINSVLDEDAEDVEYLRRRFEGYSDEELQIFNGDNEETLKNWNRKDAIEDAINSVLDEGDYAKGGETKIYEVATKIKGKSGQFASSVRAKSKEEALRIYKQKHGDDKNKVIVDVYETSRKRLEDGGEMAHGGSTHEQGYDDREDESLAMRHGKIASKDFVGSHKRREHSRRDDAQFEERHKKAYGGLTDSSIELLD